MLARMTSEAAPAAAVSAGATAAMVGRVLMLLPAAAAGSSPRLHGSGHARRGRLSGRCQGGCIGQPRQPVSGAGQRVQTFRGQQRHTLVRAVFVQNRFQIIRQGTLLLFQCRQQLFFRAIQHFLRQPCTLRRWPDGQPGPAGMSGAGRGIRGRGRRG